MPRTSASPNFWLEVRQLIRLATPLFTAQILISSATVIDTLMSGRYSAMDLAGVAVGSGIWLPVSLAISGFLIAATAIVARQFGAGTHDRVANTVQQSIWLALLLALPAFLFLINSKPLLVMFDVDEQLLPITSDYLFAVAFGLPGLALFSGLRAFAEGMGNTKPFMFSSLAAFVLNIILNYGFIYGHWGLPELGGVGCGWATAISMWAQGFILLWLTSGAKKFEGIDLYGQFHRPSWVEIKSIASIGLPISLAVLAEVSIFSIIALLLAPLGAEIVAGHQIALSVSHMLFMLPLSLSQAITIRVGHALGRGEQWLANGIARVGLMTALTIAVVNMVMILWSKEAIASYFTTDVDVQGMAISLMIYMAIYQVPDHVQIAFNATLRAYHDTKVPLLLILFCYWGVTLPLGYTLGRTDFFGNALAAKGFWIALLAGLTLASVLLGARLYRVATQPIDDQRASA